MTLRMKHPEKQVIAVDDTSGAQLVQVSGTLPADTAQPIVESLGGADDGTMGAGGKTLKDLVTALTTLTTALRGSSSKTLTDLDTDLTNLLAAKVVVGGNTKTQTSTTVAEALSGTSIPCKYILVQPIRTSAGEVSNTLVVKVGNSTTQTIIVAPKDSGFFIPAANANAVYILPSYAGEGVQWTAFN